MNDVEPEVSADDFFTLNDVPETYLTQTTHTDDHIYMNELEIFVERVCTHRELILFYFCVVVDPPKI